MSVLLGNLIYHAVEDDLPEAIRHQPFALDWGLLLDFAICAALLGLSFLIVPVSRSK